MTSCLDDYHSFDFTHGPWTRTVFRRGKGPAVIVIHEIPGLHPFVVRLAERIAGAGMTVHLPSLFGEPGRAFSTLYRLRSTASVICIRREFSVWATDRSSPIVEWLRALARHAQGECGGKGFVICDQIQKLFQIANFPQCRKRSKIERGDRRLRHRRRKREAGLERGAPLLEPIRVNLKQPLDLKHAAANLCAVRRGKVQ